MRLGGLAVAAVVLMGGPAMAQMDSRDAIALQNQILELRQQIQTMQQRGGASTPVYRPDRPAGGDTTGLTAQLLDRVSTMEDQVRTLRGRIDELANQQQRQSDELTKQIGDLTFAMQNGSPGAGSPRTPPASLSPPPSTLGTLPVGPGGPPPGPPPRTPEIAMQEANAALARRDYPAAEAAARERCWPRRGLAQQTRSSCWHRPKWVSATTNRRRRISTTPIIGLARAAARPMRCSAWRTP